MYPGNTEGNGVSGARGGEFVAGLVCGAAVGAAIALLLAPKSGAEIRGQLSTSARRFRRQAGEMYDQAADTVGDLVDRGRSAVRRGQEKFEEVRSNASDVGGY